LQAWKDWFDTDAPEESQIPNGYSATLSTFHKLLLIRSWCPDRTVPMAKIYIAESMGRQVCKVAVVQRSFTASEVMNIWRDIDIIYAYQ